MSEPKRVGYARVSKEAQDTALQLAALNAAGCKPIYEEKRSGVEARPALDALLRGEVVDGAPGQRGEQLQLKKGDTLVVWKLDRLGRTTLELLKVIEDLERRGIHFVSLTQGLDTSTSMGKLMLVILAGFAEFERNIIIERTTGGLKAANAKGHFGGRRPSLTGEMLARMQATYAAPPISPLTGKRMTITEIAKMFGVSKTTAVRYGRNDGVPSWGPMKRDFLARYPDKEAWEKTMGTPGWGRNPQRAGIWKDRPGA